MAGDVSRLVLQVDASVELARRNLSALAAAVEGDAKKMDQSLARVDQAHARLAKTSGSARVAQMEFMHVITASTDALNAGMPVSRVFAMEIGRITEAAQFATQGTGAFAKFIGGPWGIALQVGISLLTMLATRHGEAGKAASDQKIEDMDLTKALKALDEATKGAITSERQHQIELLNSARAVNAKAVATRDATQAALRDAMATAEARERAFKEQGPNLRGAARADLRDAALTARGTVASLQVRLKENEAAIVEAERRRAAALIPLMEQRSKELTDPEEGARAAAARQVDALRAAFDKAGDLSEDAVHRFIGAEARINAARDAEIKKIEEQRHAHTPSLGSQVTTEQGRNLLASAEHFRNLNESRDNGALRDLFAQAHVNVDPKMTAWCAAFVNAVLATNGLPGTGSLSARSFLNYGTATNKPEAGDIVVTRRGTGGQGHVGFFQSTDAKGNILVLGGNTGNAVGTERVSRSDVLGFRRAPTASEAARSSETQADRQQRQQDAFADRLAQANGQLLAAQQAAAKGAEDSVDIQIFRVQQERKAQEDADHRFVVENHLTQADEDLLTATRKRTAAAKVAALLADDQLKTTRERFQAEIAAVRDDEDIARAHAQLARTTSERRDSALTLLDLSQQQERLQLQEVIETSKDLDQVRAAKARLGHLDDLRDLQRQVINRENAGPGQHFLDQLNSKSINEQLDEVKVRGLQSLEDELAGVISGTESVSHAFKRMAQSIIADLARIAIEKEIILPLANMLFGGTGGGGGGGNFLSALGSATGSMQGFAAGGDPPVGRVSLVGERGPEMIVPRSPVTVIPNHMIGRGGRGGGRDIVEVHVTPNEMFDVRVDRRVAGGIAQAAPALTANAGRQVIRALTRTGING